MPVLERSHPAATDGEPGAPLRDLGLWICVVVATISGCAGWPKGPAGIADVHQERVKRATEAAEAFESKRSDAEYQAALSHWRQGNLDACRNQLDKLLDRNLEHRPALLLRIELALQEDRPADAGQRLRTLLETRPDDAELIHALGMVHEALGETEEAQDRFRQAARLDPQNELYAQSCGGDEEQEKDQAESLVSWQADEKAAGADGAKPSPDLEAPNGVLGQAVQALKRSQPAQAVQIIEQALEAEPATGALYRTLGAAHYRLGDFESAEEALMESLSLDNAHPLSYFLMGCTLSKLGQEEAAERHFQQAQRLDARYKLAE